jgi:hypothetical protein
MDEQSPVILRLLAVIVCVLAFITLQCTNLAVNVRTTLSAKPSLRLKFRAPANYLAHFVEMIASKSKGQTSLKATIAPVAIAPGG